MADPTRVREILRRTTSGFAQVLSPTHPLYQAVNAALDRGADDAEIISALTSGAITPGQEAAAVDAVRPQVQAGFFGGFDPSADPNQLAPEPPVQPDPSTLPFEFREDFDRTRGIQDTFRPAAQPSGVDMVALVGLLDSAGYEFAGFNEDGTIKAFHFGSNKFFDLDQGGPGGFTVLRESPDSGGAGSVFRPPFLGTDKDGNALFSDGRGGVIRGENIDFAKVDPQEKFELEQRARQQAELEFASDVIANGGDFLFREAFAQGLIGGGGPQDRQFTSTQDILSQLLGRTADEAVAGAPAGGGAGGFDFSATPLGRGLADGTIPQAAADAFVPQGQTASRAAELDAAGVAFGGSEPQQTGLAALSRETIGATSPIRRVLGGEGFRATPGTPFRTAAPSDIRSLTREQVEAADTASRQELNIPFEDIEQRAREEFFSPTRRTPARATLR